MQSIQLGDKIGVYDFFSRQGSLNVVVHGMSSINTLHKTAGAAKSGVTLFPPVDTVSSGYRFLAI